MMWAGEAAAVLCVTECASQQHGQAADPHTTHPTVSFYLSRHPFTCSFSIVSLRTFLSHALTFTLDIHPSFASSSLPCLVFDLVYPTDNLAPSSSPISFEPIISDGIFFFLGSLPGIFEIISSSFQALDSRSYLAHKLLIDRQAFPKLNGDSSLPTHRAKSFWHALKFAQETAKTRIGAELNFQSSRHCAVASSFSTSRDGIRRNFGRARAFGSSAKSLSLR